MQRNAIRNTRSTQQLYLQAAQGFLLFFFVYSRDFRNFAKQEKRNMQTDNKVYVLPDMGDSLCEQLGIRFTLLEEGLAKAIMPVDERTCQPFGVLHGGASLALAESVAGHGSVPLCPPGHIPCGIQVSGNHLRMVPKGTTVEATGRLIFRGRTQHIWNVDITTPDGKLVSTARVVNQLVKQRT